MLCLHQANLEETMEKWFLAEHMETNFVDEEHIGHAYAIEATSHRPTISATDPLFLGEPPSPIHAGDGIQRHRERLPHLVWRPNSEQLQPGSKDGDDALNQSKACHGQSWITLDNEP